MEVCQFCGEEHAIAACLKYRAAIEVAREVMEEKSERWLKGHQACPVCGEVVKNASNACLYASSSIGTVDPRNPQRSYQAPDIEQAVKCETCGWKGPRGECFPLEQ